LDALDWHDAQACQAGDNDACARLFRRHQADVTRQMWRFSRDPAVCQELAHEVFVEMYLSIGRYRPRAVPFVHWLRRIATRVGYRYWKQQARRQRQVPLGDFDRAVTAAAPGDPAAAAALLHALLARLAPADRLVLTLMYFEECSIAEIARRTGWNRLALKMRAHRARLRLKEVIERAQLRDQLQELSYENA